MCRSSGHDAFFSRAAADSRIDAMRHRFSAGGYPITSWGFIGKLDLSSEH
jgi:hypothetical protein